MNGGHIDRQERPTKDLKKKGLRLQEDAQHDGVVGPTKDLKKKGLRREKRRLLRYSTETNQRPEKEGIKTPIRVRSASLSNDQPKT